MGMLYGAYQLYAFTDYGPGVPFYEYRDMMLNYKKYTSDDIARWIEKNYNRETLLNPSLSRLELWPMFISECHLNWGLLLGSSIVGGVIGRKVFQMHMDRFIRGKKGYYTIKYLKREGHMKNNGTHNQVFTYSQNPYLTPWESYGYLKDCTFRVPLNLYLDDIIVDVKKALEFDEGESLMHGTTIKGHFTVNIVDPQKASVLYLNMEDSLEMGIATEQYIIDVILSKVRENKLLVKHMQENPEEYIKYLNKYLKQLLKQNLGIQVLNSDVIVTTRKDEENEEYKEESVHF